MLVDEDHSTPEQRPVLMCDGVCTSVADFAVVYRCSVTPKSRLAVS